MPELMVMPSSRWRSHTSRYNRDPLRRNSGGGLGVSPRIGRESNPQSYPASEVHPSVVCPPACPIPSVRPPPPAHVPHARASLAPWHLPQAPVGISSGERSPFARSHGTLPPAGTAETRAEKTVKHEPSPTREGVSVLSSTDGEIGVFGGTFNAANGNLNHVTVQVHLNGIGESGQSGSMLAGPLSNAPIPVKSESPEASLPTCPPDALLEQRGFSDSFQPQPPQLTSIPEQSINHVYYRLLSSKKRGSPLWIPGTNKRLPIEYQRSGLGIGDVGVIAERGFFDSLFNITLPRDHPLAINSDGLPDNFYPLNITPSDIQEYSEFKQGSYLSSASIKNSYKDDNSSGLAFESSASEGAVLTLPDGSNSEDLGNKKKLQHYLSEHGEAMYRCALNQHGRIIKNGDLRVVTGYDKTTNWAMAAFSNSKAEPDSESFHLKFRPRDSGVGARTLSWESSGSAEVKAGPDMREIVALRRGDPLQQHVEYENQTVFVRTENITLKKETWIKLLSESGAGDIELKNESSSHFPSWNSTQCSHSTESSSSSSQSPSTLGGHQGPQCGDSRSTHSSLSNTLVGIVMVLLSTVIHRTASSLCWRLSKQAVHPSNGINEILLKLNPDARMAVTGDKCWISVLTDEDSVLPPVEQLWARIEESFVVLQEDGVVFLDERKIQTTTPQSCTASMDAYPSFDSTNSANADTMLTLSPTGFRSHSLPLIVVPISSSVDLGSTHDFLEHGPHWSTGPNKQLVIDDSSPILEITHVAESFSPLYPNSTGSTRSCKLKPECHRTSTGLASHVPFSACRADEVPAESDTGGVSTRAPLEVLSAAPPDQLNAQVLDRLQNISGHNPRRKRFRGKATYHPECYQDLKTCVEDKEDPKTTPVIAALGGHLAGIDDQPSADIRTHCPNMSIQQPPVDGFEFPNISQVGNTRISGHVTNRKSHAAINDSSMDDTMDCRVIALRWYKSTSGLEHEFVVAECHRPGGVTFYLRIEPTECRRPRGATFHPQMETQTLRKPTECHRPGGATFHLQMETRTPRKHHNVTPVEAVSPRTISDLHLRHLLSSPAFEGDAESAENAKTEKLKAMDSMMHVSNPEGSHGNGEQARLVASSLAFETPFSVRDLAFLSCCTTALQPLYEPAVLQCYSYARTIFNLAATVYRLQPNCCNES